MPPAIVRINRETPMNYRLSALALGATLLVGPDSIHILQYSYCYSCHCAEFRSISCAAALISLYGAPSRMPPAIVRINRETPMNYRLSALALGATLLVFIVG
jgi:hypothetical protein